MIAMATLLLAVMQAEPPTTVNDQILGDAADFTTAGPATICLRDLAIAAAAGEHVALRYSGIHNGSLRWTGSAGSLDFDQSEIWKMPRSRGRLIGRFGGFSVHRKRREGQPAYLAFRQGDDGTMKLDSRISGSALDGSKHDEALLARLLQQDRASATCDRSYAYGWGVIFGDEGVSENGGD